MNKQQNDDAIRQVAIGVFEGWRTTKCDLSRDIDVLLLSLLQNEVHFGKVLCDAVDQGFTLREPGKEASTARLAKQGSSIEHTGTTRLNELSWHLSPSTHWRDLMNRPLQ